MGRHICMAGPMTAYRCYVKSVLEALMPCRHTNFCLLLLSAVPYFTLQNYIRYTDSFVYLFNTWVQCDQIWRNCDLMEDFYKSLDILLRFYLVFGKIHNLILQEM